MFVPEIKIEKFDVVDVIATSGEEELAMIPPCIGL